MLSSKISVDRQVRNFLAKLRTDNERNLRGFMIAKLYYKVGEYTTALIHVNNYLSAKGEEKADTANAYKLRGACLESLNKPMEAFLAFQRSLHINPKQSDLLIKVCKHLLNHNIDLSAPNNQNVARHWCNVAQSENIAHESILDLKLKLRLTDIDTNNGSGQEGGTTSLSSSSSISTTTSDNKIEGLLMREIQDKPDDCNMHIRLLRFYMDNGKSTEAFEYTHYMEIKDFSNYLSSASSIDWYSTVLLVMNKYTRSNTSSKSDETWNYWLMYIIVLEKLVELHLRKLNQTDYDTNTPAMNLNETIETLFEFDQKLKVVSDCIEKICTERIEMTQEFLKHYRGQLCLHTATLLIHQQLTGNKQQWSDTKKKILPLLLMSYNCGIVQLDKDWLYHCSDVAQDFLRKWQHQSAFRCVQVGRTLLACIDDTMNSLGPTFKRLISLKCNQYNSRQSSDVNWLNDVELLIQIRKTCSDSNWRNTCYRELFNGIDYISKISSSYLIKCAELSEPTNYELPTVIDMQKCCDVAELYKPFHLPTMVYLAIGNPNLINVTFTSIKSMHYSVTNLMHCEPDTLNQLDFDTFLYAATIQAKQNLEVDQFHYETGAQCRQTNKPMILPYAIIAKEICSKEQKYWWAKSYRAFKHSEQVFSDRINLGESRILLKNGIEAVRGIGTPKMDLCIVFKLAQLLHTKLSDTLTTQSQKMSIMDRVISLYKCGFNQLKHRHDHSTVGEPTRYLFKYKQIYDYNYDLYQEVNKMAEEAVQFLAPHYFKNEQYKEFIDDMSNIELPYVFHYKAEAYHYLYNSENTTMADRTLYMEKYKELLNNTRALLDNSPNNNMHPLKSIVDSDINRYNNESPQKQQQQQQPSTSLKQFTTFNNNKNNLPANTKEPNNLNMEILMKEIMSTLSSVKLECNEIRTKLNGIEIQLNNDKKSNAKAVGEMRPDFYDSEEDYLDLSLNNNNLNLSHFQQQSQHPQHQHRYQQQQQQQQQHQMQQNINNRHFMAQGAAAPPPPPPPLSINDSFPYGMAMNPYIMQQQMLPLPHGLFPMPLTMQGPPPPQPSLLPQLMNQQQLNFDLANSANIINAFNQQNPAAALQLHYPASSVPAQPHTVLMQHERASNILPSSVSGQMSGGLETPVVPTQLMTMPARPLNNQLWNSQSMEKSLPVNVVITSSDPLPTYTTVTNQQPTLSVNIPKQHLKNNNDIQPTPSTTTITFAGGTEKDNYIGGKKEHLNTSIQADKDIFPRNTSFQFQSTPVSSSPIQIGTTSSFGSTSATKCNEIKQFSKITYNATKPKPNLFKNFSFSTAVNDSSVNSSSSSTSVFGNFSVGATSNANVFSTNTTSTSVNTNLDNFTNSKTLFGGPFTTNTLSNPQQSLNINNSIFTSNSTPVEDTHNKLNQSGGSVGKPTDEDDYVPTAEFVPVIPLPDIVVVKTGEENEIILFEHRAKLLRFIKETKEWKERGIGNVKLLVQKNDATKVRILMRREQVLKLCCNQLIMSDTKFTKMPNTSALTWYGQDFSENELQIELLAIRFKSLEICNQFHDAILTAQSKMVQSSEKKNVLVDDGGGGKKEGNGIDKPRIAVQGFGDKYLPVAGSWNCTECYVSNKQESMNCVACNSPNKLSKAPTLTHVPPSKCSFGNSTNTTTTTMADTQNSLENFSNLFKPKPGSWSCSACYVTNTVDDIYCLACESPKDNTIIQKKTNQITTSNVTPSPHTFSFGFTAPTSINNAINTNNTNMTTTSTTTASTTITTVKSDKDPVDKQKNDGFVFGDFSNAFTFNSTNPVDDNQSLVSKNATNDISISSSSTANTNIFNSPSIKTTTSSTSSVNTFNFNMKTSMPTFNLSSSLGAGQDKALPFTGSGGGSGSNTDTFKFVFNSQSPTLGGCTGELLVDPLQEYTIEDISDEENIEEENNTYFAPVIPLPDKIDVITGEENEEVLFSHRAKLFRFDDGEWKERGLGDIKILRNSEKKTLRVLMRREKILKICLNHALTPNISYVSKDDKTWLFAVNDFSDNELVLMKFCIRFKSPEIATEFIEAINKSLGNLTTTSSLDDTIEDVVNNITFNDDGQSNSSSNNNNIEGTHACSGCRGCVPDEYIFNENLHNDLFDETSLPLEIPQHLLNRVLKDIMAHKQKNTTELTSTSATDCRLMKSQTTFNIVEAQNNQTTFGGSDEGGSIGTASAQLNDTVLTPSKFCIRIPKSKSPEKTIIGNKPMNIFAINDNSETTAPDNIFDKLKNNETTIQQKNPFTLTDTNIFGSKEKTIAVTTVPNNAFGNIPNVSTTAATSSIFSFDASVPFKFSFTQMGSSPSLNLTDSQRMATISDTSKTITDGESNTNGMTVAAAAPVTETKSFKFNFEEAMKTDVKQLPPVDGHTEKRFEQQTQGVTTPSSSLLHKTIFPMVSTANQVESSVLSTAATTTTNTNTTNTNTTTSASTITTNKQDNQTTSSIFKLDPNMTFERLAAQNASLVIDDSKKTEILKGGFFGLSQKDDFSGFLRSGTNNNSVNDSISSGKGEDGDDGNYDPHYDPIIELPAEIVITTGEEDEIKLFGERATLFRFDTTNKEWRERGVGEFKILQHKTKGTYRFLMRREQIHKCVLNHSIGVDFNLKPMSSVGTSFLWATQNFAEDEPTVEQLSVRFKQVDIASQFKGTVDQCINQLKSKNISDNIDDNKKNNNNNN